MSGTVGEDDQYLMSFRTDPVRIPLHVERLLEENDEYGREDERTAISDRYQPLYREFPVGDDFSEQDRVRWEELSDQEEAELEALDKKWEARYEAYAAKLTACVREQAAGIEGLGVPVIVEAVTVADAPHDQVGEHLFDRYHEGHVDEVAVRLWETCVEAVPRPGSVTDAAAHTDTYETSDAVEASGSGLVDEDADDINND